MSFRRHYGTGSYSSSLLSSPLTGSYGSSRGLGGYSSTSPHSYSSFGSGYSSYSGYGTKSPITSTSLSRSASLPREVRDRSIPRYSACSRGASPARSSLTPYSSSSSYFDSSDSSSSGAGDLISNLKRSHTFSPGYTRNGLTSSIVPRLPYNTTKSYVRSSRSKSVGSESGYGSRSGSVSERADSKGPTSSHGSSAVNSRPSSRGSSLGPENGDIDYKKLYEEQLEENFRVHERLRGTETELRLAREAIETNNKKNNTRLAMAEADKREKRALERKLSEMEEELKQLQKLKAENEKLKAENRALTRVVSKLTNSATAGMGNLASLSK